MFTGVIDKSGEKVRNKNQRESFKGRLMHTCRYIQGYASIVNMLLNDTYKRDVVITGYTSRLPREKILKFTSQGNFTKTFKIRQMPESWNVAKRESLCLLLLSLCSHMP